MKRIIAIISIAFTLALAQFSWPVPPQNQVHPIGNAWGNFQDYGSGPYTHNGNDIMVAALAPVVVIKYGYVKRIWHSGTLYQGITVADSAGAAFCSGYMYYHDDSASIRVQAGDTVYVADTIARTVTWPVANFHHDHFSKNRNSGVTWSSYGGFFRNPLREFTPDNDSTVPSFINAVSGQRFAICRNNTSTYLSRDSVYGDVDFICRLNDKINHRTWLTSVYRILWGIHDTLNNWMVTMRFGVQFSESLDSYTPTQARVIYKIDGTCNTNCNYDSLARRYFYIVTNADADSVIETTDSLNGWASTSVTNRAYWLVISANDEYGNTVRDSMLFRVKNPVGIEDDSQASGLDPSWLIRAHPNPANRSVNFLVRDPGEVVLTAYDASGRIVWSRSTIAGARPVRSITWSGIDGTGRPLPDGVYIIEARGSGRTQRIKLSLIR